MSFFRSLKNECTKMLLTPVPVLCALMVFALCCVSDVFTDDGTGKGYSVLSILLMENRNDFIEQNMIFCERVIRSAVSEWFIMFAPVICALPFVRTVAAEKTAYRRFTMLRVSKSKYMLSRLISGMLSAGLSLTVGYILFVILAAVFFPAVSNSDYNLSFSVLHGMSITNFYMSSILGVFLIGVSCFIPCFIISIFDRNKYIMLCLPFMLLHFYAIVVNKIIDGMEKSERIYAELFSPKYIFRTFENHIFRYEILLILIMTLSAAGMSIAIVNGRSDCCE